MGKYRVPCKVHVFNHDRTFATAETQHNNGQFHIALPGPHLQQRLPRMSRKLRSPSLLESIADVNDRGLGQPCGLSRTMDQLRASWDALPAHRRVTVAACLAFVISNMDKVNLSIAIIPMSEQFGWSPSVAGLVQSAFFYGFLLAQVPGGYLASRVGGRKTLPAGLALWSAATAAVPFSAVSLSALCLTRATVGMGEAVAPTSIVDMIARVVPKEERATAVSTAFSGLHFGSLVGLIASPILIHAWGWESLFLCFGAVGLVWYVWFDSLLQQVRAENPELVDKLDHKGGPCTETGSAVPYRAFIRSPPVQALMFTHFCNNWFHYTMLAWLPTYFTQTLQVDLFQAAQTALLPPLAGLAASAAAGPLADSLISGGVPVPVVRKVMQSIAFLLPTLFMCTAAYLDGLSPEAAAAAGLAPDTLPLMLVACLTAALGFNSFSLAGLYCTHTDMSTKYASAMLGVTNATGALPGIFGVATVGILYDLTDSWSLALLWPGALLMVAGAAVYVRHCSNDIVDFDAADNSPFPVELAVRDAWRALQQRLMGSWGARGFLQQDTVRISIRDSSFLTGPQASGGRAHSGYSGAVSPPRSSSPPRRYPARQ